MKSRTYCAVYGCMNSSLSNPEITFFRLPGNSERRLQWLQLIHRDDLENKPNFKSYRVCEKHFNMEDVLQSSNRKRLKQNALPLLMLPSIASTDPRVSQKENKQTQTAPLVRNESLKVNEFDKSAIGKKVHNFYMKGEVPSLMKMIQALNDDEDLPSFTRSQFQQILKTLKLKRLKLQGSNLIIDRDEIILWRVNYLKTIKEYRCQNRAIFYLDETWINAGDTSLNTSENNTVHSKSAKESTPKSNHLIAVHIGNENGFVKNAEGIFGSMDTTCFETWFQKNLPKLGKNAVVVMDHVPFNSRRVEKIPTMLWQKTKIQDWLRSKEIDFDENNIKAELIMKVNEVKAQYRDFIVNKIAQKYKVEVLRIPPYHCDLNPLEFVWADIKENVEKINTTSNSEDLKKLIKDCIKKVTPLQWRNSINRVRQVEDNFYSKLDNLIDNTIDNFIEDATNLDIGEESSSGTDSDEEFNMWCML